MSATAPAEARPVARNCPKCGKELPAGAETCPSCEAESNAVDAKPPETILPRLHDENTPPRRRGVLRAASMWIGGEGLTSIKAIATVITAVAGAVTALVTAIVFLWPKLFPPPAFDVLDFAVANETAQLLSVLVKNNGTDKAHPVLKLELKMSDTSELIEFGKLELRSLGKVIAAGDTEPLEYGIHDIHPRPGIRRRDLWKYGARNVTLSGAVIDANGTERPLTSRTRKLSYLLPFVLEYIPEGSDS